MPLAALEFESPSAAIIATPVPALSRATNLFVFLLVVSTLVASGLIHIDKIVSASGKLVAEAPNIVIQPFDKSIVESIDVRKGDIIRQGQVLARLNPTISAADLTAMKDQVDLLNAKAARLEAQTAGKVYVPDPANPHAGLASPRSSINKQASISLRWRRTIRRSNSCRPRSLATNAAGRSLSAASRPRHQRRRHAPEASGSPGWQ